MKSTLVLLTLLLSTLSLTACLTKNEDQLKAEITEKGNITLNENNPIKLPDNIITEKDCITVGGKVWNTLGETTYNGIIIGTVEGMNCPCVCLVETGIKDNPVGYLPITKDELIAFSKERLKRVKNENITIDNWKENRDPIVARAEKRAEILLKIIESKYVKTATLFFLQEEAEIVIDILMFKGDYLAEAQRPKTYIDKLIKFSNSQKELTQKYTWNHHYTWDMNEDEINDCTNDYDGDTYLGCDDTQDYSKPKYIIPGVEDGIVFDKVSKKWVHKTGICHTCTEENGYGKDGEIVDKF